MNAQEAYDGIVAHFSRPNAQFGYSYNGNTAQGSCVYRGDRDPTSPIRCAVGCLMPDDLYDPGFEGIGIYDLIAQETSISGMFGTEKETFYFVREAQRLHDRSANRTNGRMSKFLEDLDKLAVQHGLEVKS